MATVYGTERRLAKRFVSIRPRSLDRRATKGSPTMSTSVLHVIASSHGGGAVHVLTLAQALRRRGLSVQVAMGSDQGNVRPEAFESSRIPLHQLAISSGLSLRELWRLRSISDGVDVVHAHGARAALFARLAAASLHRRRPRTVYTVHGFAIPHYKWRRRTFGALVERSLARWTDKVIAVSTDERTALLSAGPYDEAQVTTVLNGCDVTAFTEVVSRPDVLRDSLGIPRGALLITTACRLAKPRDLPTVLEAFARVVAAAPDVHLLIAGDGPMRSAIEQLVHSLDLAAKVTVAGWRQDMPEVYAISDIFVLTTSAWEGLPFAVLEAMASGLPIVATEAGGIPEAIDNAKQGLLVPRRDSLALANSLMSLVRDESARRRMGARAREKAEQAFSAERMADETCVIYEQLLGR